MPADLRRRWGAARGVVRIAIVGAAALTIGGLGVGLTHSPLVAAREITVIGEVHLSRADILRLAGVHVGTNVFYLDAAAARAHLVANPWVVGATVTKHPPNSIEIVIREARPVGISAGAPPVLFAQDGSDLGPVPAGTKLPLIEATGEELTRAGTSVLASIQAPFLARIERVTVGADGGVMLTLRDGVLVTFGDASDPARKAEALRAVLAWAKSQPIGVVSIDVSSPAVPTARLRGATAATSVAPLPPPSRSATPSP